MGASQCVTKNMVNHSPGRRKSNGMRLVNFYVKNKPQVANTFFSRNKKTQFWLGNYFSSKGSTRSAPHLKADSLNSKGREVCATFSDRTQRQSYTKDIRPKMGSNKGGFVQL